MMNFNNKKFEDEIDFKNIKDNPIRWFGAIYPYFIIVIIFVGLYYSAKLNTININSISPAIFDSTKQWKDIPTVKGSIVKGIEISLIKSPSREFIDKGKTLFSSTCSACHGTDGKGDGPAGAVLNPKPRAFNSSDGWINGRNFSGMYKTLQEGIKGTGMTAYEFLPIEDRVAIIHYIRTLGSDYPSVTDDEIASLNSNYSLTGDRITPSQISISKAISIVSSENRPLKDRVSLLNKEIQSDESEGARLFMKITPYPQKALAQLINNPSWKDSPEIFVSITANSGIKNGYCPGIAKLNRDELTVVFNFLKTKI